MLMADPSQLGGYARRADDSGRRLERPSTSKSDAVSHPSNSILDDRAMADLDVRGYPGASTRWASRIDGRESSEGRPVASAILEKLDRALGEIDRPGTFCA